MDFGYNDTFDTGGYSPVTDAAIYNHSTGQSLSASGTGINPSNGYQPVTGLGGGIGGNQFGQNLQLGLGAIQTLGSLWSSYQQNKLGERSLALQERAFDTNLANQTKTYNTALEDRINARYHTEGRSSQEAAATIADRKL